MKEMSKLTFSKGVIIVIAFSALVLSCINVVIQGEGDLSGTSNNLRAISIAETGDSKLRIRVFDSVYYLQVPPEFYEAWHEAGNAVCDLACALAAYVRRSIENLKDHRLP